MPSRHVHWLCLWCSVNGGILFLLWQQAPQHTPRQPKNTLSKASRYAVYVYCHDELLNSTSSVTLTIIHTVPQTNSLSLNLSFWHIKSCKSGWPLFLKPDYFRNKTTISSRLSCLSDNLTTETDWLNVAYYLNMVPLLLVVWQYVIGIYTPAALIN